MEVTSKTSNLKKQLKQIGVVLVFSILVFFGWDIPFVNVIWLIPLLTNIVISWRKEKRETISSDLEMRIKEIEIRKQEIELRNKEIEFEKLQEEGRSDNAIHQTKPANLKRCRFALNLWIG